MGLFGSSKPQATALAIPGIGGGFNPDQMAMFQQAANDSGLSAMGMGMVDQIMERQELDRLNRDLERQDRPCLLCTEQSEEE